MISDAVKWAFLRDIPARDALHPAIRQIAAHLWAAACGKERDFVLLALARARDCIRHVSDVARTGGEDIAGLTREPQPHDAIDAIMRGEDDCDAKARVFAALCLAREIPARMVPHWVDDPAGKKLKHVFVAVRLDGRELWAESTLSRARLGEWPWDVPKEANGQWLRSP